MQMSKYEILEKALYEMILSGKGIAPDGQFLGERQISKDFGVSRTTTRNAIDSLCKQGLLVQFHGKGTYVKGFQRPQPLDSITRCAQHYSEMGMTPSADILYQAVQPASRLVAQHLQIDEGESVFVLAKRFKGDRLIFNETISYFSMRHFSGIDRANFNEIPVLELMRAKYGAYAKKTEHTIEAVLPSEEIAQNLQVEPGTPVILFESVSSGVKDGQYIPFEYFRTYYRTDFIRFSFSQEHDGYR